MKDSSCGLSDESIALRILRPLTLRMTNKFSLSEQDAAQELFTAAIHGDDGTVRSLIKNGVDINIITPDGQTALLGAARKLHSYTNKPGGVGKSIKEKKELRGIIKFLLQNGANPFLGSKDGKNAANIIDSLHNNHDLKDAIKRSATQFSAANITVQP